MNKPQQPQQLNYSSILYNLTNDPITLTLLGNNLYLKQMIYLILMSSILVKICVLTIFLMVQQHLN